jgi:hypothetical protein
MTDTRDEQDDPHQESGLAVDMPIWPLPPPRPRATASRRASAALGTG